MQKAVAIEIVYANTQIKLYKFKPPSNKITYQAFKTPKHLIFGRDDCVLDNV